MLKAMIFCVVFSLFTGTAAYFLAARENQNIGVINAVRLFENYNMTKELEAAAKNDLQTLGKQMDSVRNELKVAHATNNAQLEQRLLRSYEHFKSSLDEKYSQSNHEINEQVWKRLNEAIEEFGKKKKLHLIIGANGMGAVLYNDAYYDMTEEAITYVNRKYEQGN